MIKSGIKHVEPGQDLWCLWEGLLMFVNVMEIEKKKAFQKKLST